MKIAEINMVAFGSTGRIMLQIAECVRAHGDEVKTYATYTASKRYIKPPTAPEGHSYYGSYVGNTMHAAIAKATGKNCYYSKISTKKLIDELDAFQPDIVHLHNLHAAYLNFPAFFEWLIQKRIKVVWTFHDCWPFTAKCPYFEMAGCDKWKTGCYACPQLAQYPVANKDITKKLWTDKRSWFNQLNYLHIVTPSQWLAGLVSQSFLKNHPVSVINNGIDINVFQPRLSEFRQTHHCEDKYVILGVASPWGYRKGLDVFVELANRLDSSFQIVMVGTDEKTEQQLPNNIIPIRSTRNVKELAELYSAADLFVNPTREDNYPTVNMEAIACGTPVLTFRTGGSPEMLTKDTGIAVEKNDIDALVQAIYTIRNEKPFNRDICVSTAKAFDKTEKFEAYYSLFQSIEKGTK